MVKTLSLLQPDDWHLHVRDGEFLADTVPDTARCFARAIIMPNLNPPALNTAQALAYRQRIIAALPEGNHFNPLMTLYLTDNTPPQEVVRAKNSGQIHAVKLYPAGATTHSDAGVTNIEHTYPTLEKMAEIGMPLLVHGEVTDPAVDVFDRERAFIDRVLQPLRERLPTLKIVFEHVTTADAVQFVEQAPATIAATITPHHLLYNRNAMFRGGIQPHYYCLPVLKRETHRQALLQAATSGNPKFFLGTDSAPHARHTKEAACGCAGIYNAPVAIELYAEVFDGIGKLDRLEGFASYFGADFYALPRNTSTLTLQQQPWRVPASQRFGKETIIPLRAGEQVQWQIVK
ncbi:MAG: dihydroorotase [Gammaproteobacteria bacterium]|nr:dihydroorotase [Gammaproteobacteria bacterium]